MAPSTLQIPEHRVDDWGGRTRAVRSVVRPAGPPGARARQEEQSRNDGVRVAVLAEDRLIREKLSFLVNQLPDLEVVGSAACDVQAVAWGADSPPDIVVVNPIPGRDTHLCVQRAVELLPGARVVVLNAPVVREELIGCIKAGAAGFVARGATVDEFADTIRAVAQGTSVLPASMTPLLFGHIIDQNRENAARGEHDAFKALTAREHAIAGMIVEGLCNKEIAARLGVSVHTVKTHVHHILKKLTVGSRLQLAASVRRGNAAAQRAMWGAHA